MSRNGSGTYSLPAGNPVVTGTVISSTWANNTLSDIATAITGSLAADGQTSPSANLPMATYRHTNVGAAVATTDYARADQVQNSAFQWLASVSGADTITASATPTPAAYAAGQTFRFVSAGANTGAATLNVSSLGAKAITKNGTTALAAGDIPSGAVVEVVYDGTRFQLINVKAATATSSLLRSARTSNTILGVSDNGKLIDITSGTFSQTFTAAATLGDGWYCYYRNSGTGDITLDPNASELIDGLASYVMYPGETRLIQCDGSVLTSVVVSPFSKTFTTTGTFTKPPGYSYFEGLSWSGGCSGQRNNNASAISLGGPGGGCADFRIPASVVGTTETVTIGAGGLARTTVSVGAAGGNTSFGSLFIVYGGIASGTPSGGSVRGTSVPAGTTSGASGYEGATTAASTEGASSVWGGAAACNSDVGGKSIYGGAAGGSLTAAAAVLAPGTSLLGGNGGAASSAGNGSDGVAPGGGGGATQTGTQSGAGARGELRIWGIA